MNEQTLRTAHNYLATLELRLSKREEITSDEIFSLRTFFCNNFDIGSSEFTKFNAILRLNKNKRSYFGRAGSHLLQIKVVYDHLFLIRPYSSASLSWRFNQEGRLELIDSKNLSDRSFAENILKVESENLSRNWNSADVILRNVPDELSCSISSEFYILPRDNKFDELIRYGHSEANYVANHINEGLHPPKFSPDEKRSQFPMPRLKEDGVALEILNKAARLRSELSIDCFPYASLRYY